MKDFQKLYLSDILIEKVNLSRATLKEALAFKETLEEDIRDKNIKLIIDLSQCDFMDSTFLGVIVLLKKKVELLEGQLKIVEPLDFTQSILQYTRTLQLLDTYSNIQEAVEAFREDQVNRRILEKLEI